VTEISFAGQVAIVTGGGRGLGRSYCLELARRGAAVVVNDLADRGDQRSAAADGVVAEIEAAGGRAASSCASVTAADGARAIVGTAIEHFGTLDIVVNNAGIMRNGNLEELTPEKYDAVMEVNTRGSFLVSQAAWPVLREKNYGRIVMISSAGGMFAFGGVSNYAAAKAGVYGLTKALAYEGAPHGILVNAVLPMGGQMASMDIAPPGYTSDYPAGLREKLAPRRTTEVVAVLIAVLASRACRVTGEAFSAGFGRFARVFVGVTPGWIAPDVSTVTAEDVLTRFDQIRDLGDFIVPRNQFDEVVAIAEGLGLT
jgi:NAD(P)-dependent dehydrogenase (short-subunit alcohol dehydrogenase family)